MRSWDRDAGGQVLVIVALSIAVLLLGVGLAADSGRLFVARRSAQAAADAGAWAAGVAFEAGATAAAARSAAILDVERNGYVAGGAVTVTVNAPPASGERVGDASYMEIIVEEVVTTRFLPGPVRVRARAVGGLASAGTFTEGMLALSGLASGAINASGTSTRVTVTGGAVQANSSSPTALTLSGGASLSADAVRATGGAQDLSTGAFTPAAVTGVAERPDPFLSLPGPPTTGLVSRADPLATSGSVTLSPGIYPSITISSRASVTLNPGIYIVRGGGLSVSGTGKLTGTGVLLYTTYTNYPAAFLPGTPCATVTISSDVALTAPTSGAYYGMLLFQDRSCTTAMALQVNGGATKTSLTGTIYAPKALFTLNAVSSLSTIITQIVAETIALPAGTVTLDVRDRSKLARPGLPAVVE